MIEVGAFEAKTNLSSLLEKVLRGDEFLITKRGKAVARLVSAELSEAEGVKDTVNKLLALRETTKLEGLDWKELRDVGRR